MKSLIALLIPIALLFISGCADTGSDNPIESGSNQIVGQVNLSFSSPPPGITQVVARISRQGHNPREIHLAISDSTPTASGGFGDVPTGVWHLRVDALDDSGHVRFSGETEVQVISGQIAHVTLHLHPTGGGIEIEVTWGNDPNNLLVNGSFEVGPWVGTYLPLEVGSTAIQNWVVTRQQIDYVTVWDSYHGTKSLDLNGTPSTGGIQQTFPTIAGRTYRVRFAFAGNPEGLPVIKTLGVSAANNSAVFTFNTDGKSFDDMGWVITSWEFVAAASQTSLEFYSLDANPTSYGPAVDDVSVVALN